MRKVKRLRFAPAVLVAGASILVHAAVTSATAAAGASHAGAANAGGPSIKQFNLNDYVLDAAYSLGRNTGNTFQQTCKSGTVHGFRSRARSSGRNFRRGLHRGADRQSRDGG
jgi:hypothetical protein